MDKVFYMQSLYVLLPTTAPNRFLHSVVIFMFVSVNMVAASFKQFFSLSNMIW